MKSIFSAGADLMAGETAGPTRSLRIGAVVLATALLVLIALNPGRAFAAQTHEFEAAVGAGQLTSPSGVAVDQSNGNLYVADSGTSTVRRFDSSGASLAFPATGTNSVGPFSFWFSDPQIAVDNSGGANDGDFYVTNSLGEGTDHGIKAFKASGEPANFAATGSYINGNTLTGTPSGGWAVFACGVAVDSHGLIYVGDLGGFVDIYAPTGEYLTQFAATSVCNLAVDSHGNVYANALSGEVSEFSASEFPATATTTFSGPTTVDAAASHGVTVDPLNDELYVNSGTSGSQFNSAANANVSIGVFGAERLAGGSSGIAVDRSGGTNDGDVYASVAGQVDRFGPQVTVPDVTTGEATGVTKAGAATVQGLVNPDGIELTECVFEFGTTSNYAESVPCAETVGQIGSGEADVPVHAALAGLAPGVFHFRLRTANANGGAKGADQTFAVPGTPGVEGTVATATFTEAELKATIDPSNDATSYHFEYGPTVEYGQNTPTRSIAAGNGPMSVSVQVLGLTEGSSYHFRVVAENSVGTIPGADQTFITKVRNENAVSCPNEAFRVGPSASLPDCRAYELVSPVDKNGYEVAASGDGLAGGGVQVTPDGDGVTFNTFGGAIANSKSAGVVVNYLARRSADGWSVQGLDPVLYPSRIGFVAFSGLYALTPDLSAGVIATLSPLTGSSEEGLGTINLFRTEFSSSASPQLLTPGGPAPSITGSTEPGPVLASSDAQIVAFGSPTAYANTEPGPELIPKVYRFNGSKLELASILPDGLPAQDRTEIGGGGFLSPVTGALSSDGSRLYFTDFGVTSQLFERADRQTVQVSEANTGVTDPNGPQSARYFAASRDGSRGFFTSSGKLTADATTGSADQGSDLYEFDANAPAGERLTDLSVDTAEPDGAQVQGVVGTSEDGSYVYFVALGVLDPGNGTPGSPNLYMRHRGVTTYIATLDPSEESTWNFRGFTNFNPSRISPDGASVVFTTLAPQAGYDNASHSEVYLYHAGGGLACVSCNPSGSPATSSAHIANEVNNSSAQLPFPNNLSVDGRRVFFETKESLVTRDSNGQNDVYEYEDGHIALISGGTSAEESIFVGASESGDDVFFATRQRLVPSDQDEASDLYDARVQGGFSEEGSAIPPCEGGGCRGLGSESATSAAPASTAVSGPGNPKPRKDQKKKKHKKHKKHQQHKRHEQKQKGNRGKRDRTANSKRGGAK
jgi:NHL repeat